MFSRIHVDDIALAIVAAMQHLKPSVSIYHNVADDEPTPSTIVDEYAATLPPMAQEFYSHNRRVSNAKLQQEFNI